MKKSKKLLIPFSASDSTKSVYLIAFANASIVKQSTVASLPASVEGQQTRPSKKDSQPENHKSPQCPKVQMCSIIIKSVSIMSLAQKTAINKI